jgi:hypothetical protein
MAWLEQAAVCLARAWIGRVTDGALEMPFEGAVRFHMPQIKSKARCRMSAPDPKVAAIH